MVNRCLRCEKMIVNYNLYCEKCEEAIKLKQEKEEDIKKKKYTSDFFERQKMNY